MSAPAPSRSRSNGRKESAVIETHSNLVELLNRFGLGGARESCGQGLLRLLHGPPRRCRRLGLSLSRRCGRRQNHHHGRKAGRRRHAVAGAAGVHRGGAFQCGFCTPGFVLMTHQLLERNPDPTEDDIRHYLSGNLCRCAAYPEIVEAVRLAAQRQ